ncbi:glycolate oxidase FAD binding subunit, partial [Acidithiobacillus sp. GGI-221]
MMVSTCIYVFPAPEAPCGRHRPGWAAKGCPMPRRRPSGWHCANSGTIFFQGDAPLWRLAVAPATPPLPLGDQTLIEWGGGQRWLRGALDATALRQLAAEHGGHATLFRGGNRRGEVFHPLAPPLLAMQQRL